MQVHCHKSKTLELQHEISGTLNSWLSELKIIYAIITVEFVVNINYIRMFGELHALDWNIGPIISNNISPILINIPCWIIGLWNVEWGHEQSSKEFPDRYKKMHSPPYNERQNCADVKVDLGKFCWCFGKWLVSCHQWNEIRICGINTSWPGAIRWDAVAHQWTVNTKTLISILQQL